MNQKELTKFWNFRVAVRVRISVLLLAGNDAAPIYVAYVVEVYAASSALYFVNLQIM